MYIQLQEDYYHLISAIMCSIKYNNDYKSPLFFVDLREKKWDSEHLRSVLLAKFTLKLST